MKRLILLFDADDTLLDFDRAETNSIKKVFDDYGILGYENIVESYKKFNADCWEEYEKGLLTKEELGRERFRRLYEKYGIEGFDLDQTGLDYWKYLSKAGDYIEGVHEFLEKIYQDHEMYVITNGIGSVQKGRFEGARLGKYFIHRFVSEEMGTRKPEKKFFDLVKGSIKDFDDEKAVVIGDSMSSDIQGGINANLKTIWFNKKHKKNKYDIKADYEVDNYDALYELIKKLAR